MIDRWWLFAFGAGCFTIGFLVRDALDEEQHERAMRAVWEDSPIDEQWALPDVLPQPPAGRDLERADQGDSGDVGRGYRMEPASGQESGRGVEADQAGLE